MSKRGVSWSGRRRKIRIVYIFLESEILSDAWAVCVPNEGRKFVHDSFAA